MTSKECLDLLMLNQKQLKSGHKFTNLKTGEQLNIEDCYEIIKKELEVLEILKKHSTRLDDEDWNSNIFNGIDFENLDEDDREIIKEWLENE